MAAVWLGAGTGQQVLSDSIDPQSGGSEGGPGHSIGARRPAAATSGRLRPTSNGSRLGRAGPAGPGRAGWAGPGRPGVRRGRAAKC